MSLPLVTRGTVQRAPGGGGGLSLESAWKLEDTCLAGAACFGTAGKKRRVYAITSGHMELVIAGAHVSRVERG